jgi:hypothetical protein
VTKGKKVSLRIYIWAARQLLPPNIIHMTFSPTRGLSSDSL